MDYTHLHKKAHNFKYFMTFFHCKTYSIGYFIYIIRYIKKKWKLKTKIITFRVQFHIGLGPLRPEQRLDKK